MPASITPNTHPELDPRLVRGQMDSKPGGQVTPTTVSRLESPPPEVCNAIYELVLIPAEGVTLARRPHTARLWMVSPRRGNHLLALTATSRRIRNDALPLFYGMNTFTLSCTPELCGVSYAVRRASSIFLLEKEFKDDVLCLSAWLQIISASISEHERILNLVVDTSTWFTGCTEKIPKAWAQSLGDF
ncbi:hypothetical protein B0A55_12426, partial [Friedmanniomyces simplex]